MMAISFFEKAFALFRRLVHFSLVRPQTVATFAQSTFSPLAIDSNANSQSSLAMR
jgi:hypothetical protein